MNDMVSQAQSESWTKNAPGDVLTAAAAGLFLAIAALFLFSWLVPADVVNKAAIAQIRQSTGLEARIGGSSTFRIFPRPRIEIHGIRIADKAGAIALDAPNVVGYVRLLPLLVGRFEIGQAVFYQPKLFIDFSQTPVSRGGALQQSIAASDPGRRWLQAPLGVISIIDGAGQIRTRKGAPPTPINDINMHLSWPRVGASAEFGGSLVFRGALTRLQGWLDKPLEVLRGGQSASVFQLKSDLLTFWSSGHLSNSPKLQFNGSIAATAPSLRKLAETLGYAFSKRGTFADLDLTCDVDFDTNSATFTNLALHLDGNDYQGSLAIENLGQTPHFSGTLASDVLDVTPFLTDSRASPVADGLWSRKPLDFRQLDLADLDFRVSAARLRLYDLEVRNAAFSLLTKPGMIDFALAEASSNDGAMRGRVEVTEKDHLFNLRISGSGSGIDLQPMVFAGHRPMSGMLNAAIDFNSSGENLEALMEGLTGRAALAATNGSFAGIDLVPTLASSIGKTPGQPLSVTSGTTNFDQLNLSFLLEKGVAAVTSGQMTMPNAHFHMGGTIDIGRRQLDLVSLADITEMSGKSSKSVPARFELKGPWSAPRFYQTMEDLKLPKPSLSGSGLPNTTMAPPPDP